ncbi:hypothetical protein BDQ17DRAFT_1355216 [Cyathus striatus]|nr:hypothetical protein BDQ17DRAFT_1355216 [Cyathus striatus]
MYPVPSLDLSSVPYTVTTTTTTHAHSPVVHRHFRSLTPRSTFCSPLSALPVEIWLNILPFLPPSDLHTISLVSSLFRSIAQPLLFTTLDISPFFLTYSTTRPILRPNAYLDRTKHRVALYQQPHIAHAVQHVWVSPYSRRGFPLRNNRDHLDPSELIQLIIDALPSFPNLDTLSWHCTDFKPEWWAVISRIPLKRLWLNSCAVKSPAPLLPSVTHLDLDHWAWEGQVTNHISIHEERSNGVHASLFLLVVHPDTIASISVPRIDTALRLLMAIHKSFPSYPSSASCSLKSLTLPFPALASAFFVPALQRCPNLEMLRLLPPMDVSSPQQDFPLGPIPRDCIPHLRSFEGPYTRLLDFAVSRHIHDLILWGFDDLPAQCDAAALVDTLHVLAAMGKEGKAVRVLKVAMLTITVSFMRCLELFEDLREVAIESLDGPLRYGGHSPSQKNYPFEFDSKSPISLLFCILRDIDLPPHLTHLTIHTRLNSGNQDSAQQKNTVALFIEGLAARHTALCKVEIGWGVYWTGMFIATWERVNPTDRAISAATSHDEQIKLMLQSSQVDDTERDSMDSGYHSIQSSLASCLDSYPSQRTLVTHAMLPLGKLTFTEHRRRTVTMCAPSGASWMYVGSGEVRNDRWFQKLATRLRGVVKRYLRI